jgi:hypothetical protein
MLALIQAGLAFASGIMTAWNQARTLYNAPDMIKGKVAQAHQDYADGLNKANAVFVNPASTPADHQKALNLLRLADS